MMPDTSQQAVGIAAEIIVHRDNGTTTTIPVVTHNAMIVEIVAKAKRDGIPLHLLIADYYWHRVAHELGTTRGWHTTPVDGHTFPLPRPGISAETYLRSIEDMLASNRSPSPAGD